MAKRKYEFRPDKLGPDIFSKLYLTPKQRHTLLRWILHAVVLVVLSVIQDVIMSRIHIFRATTDLVPCAIILLCILLGADRASVFSLIAAMLYKFSGTAPGHYVIALIPIFGLTAAVLRKNLFRKSIAADILCAGVAVVGYEISLFGVGLLFHYTIASYGPRFFLTALYSLVFCFVLYPIFTAIEKIGGEPWKE